MTKEVERIEKIWPSISDLLYIPRNEAEYDRLVALLDQLIDEVGQNEAHSLAPLMDVIGLIIEKYEDENVPELV